MQRWPVLGLLLGAALTLQGCVAVLLPIAAVGVIGKKEVDKARARTRAAEEGFDPALIDKTSPQVFVGEAPADHHDDYIPVVVDSYLPKNQHRGAGR